MFSNYIIEYKVLYLTIYVKYANYLKWQWIDPARKEHITHYSM